MGATDVKLKALLDYKRLLTRNKRDGVVDVDKEPMTEAQFVRGFGTKVRQVRWSRRIDMVGLILLGKNTGIWITRGPNNLRRVRVLNVADGKMQATQRFLELKSGDSLSNLQPGLLNWVQ